MWNRKTKSTWLHDDGYFIAKFNWGSAGIFYLLYSSREEYEKECGDYKSFKLLSEAKSGIIEITEQTAGYK